MVMKSDEVGTKVAVIDDEEGLRDLLHVGLGMDGFEVRSAADGVAGLELIRSWQPDCILLDVMLPKIDGFTLIAMIRRLTQAPILMLTARSEVRDRIEGLRSGADDYIPKPFDLEELALRVRAAVRRPTMREVEHVTFEDLTIDLQAHTVARGGRYLKLSAREFALLVTLARRPKRVFTRDELLDLVWGSERDTSPQTVETYISYLRQKVDAGFPTPLIHTVRGVGYTLRGTP
jgi:DNA-binding response OmpR family regulator